MNCVSQATWKRVGSMKAAAARQSRQAASSRQPALLTYVLASVTESWPELAPRRVMYYGFSKCSTPNRQKRMRQVKPAEIVPVTNLRRRRYNACGAHARRRSRRREPMLQHPQSGSYAPIRRLLNQSQGVPVASLMQQGHVHESVRALVGNCAGAISVHQDDAARLAAALIGSHACCLGERIFLGPTVGTALGPTLSDVLHHELVHVAQVAVARRTGRVAPRAALEHEASALATDRGARRVVSYGASEDEIYPAAFAAITCPVLMIHGEADPHPGRLTSEDLRRYIPHLEYQELPKCGHSPWLERQARAIPCFSHGMDRCSMATCGSMRRPNTTRTPGQVCQ